MIHPSGTGFSARASTSTLPRWCDRGCPVEQERAFFIGGRAKGNRVGPQHRFHAEGGRNRGPGVGEAHPDHPCFNRHQRVITIDPEVVRIAHRHRAHAVLSGFLNRHAHRAVGDHMAHPGVPVDQCRGRSFPHDLELGYRHLGSGPQLVVIHL